MLFITHRRIPLESVRVTLVKVYLPSIPLTPHTTSMSTPVPSGRATPPVPQGAGNPIGTPVVAPTRSSTGKDGTSSNLGTFGVSTSVDCIVFQRD